MGTSNGEGWVIIFFEEAESPEGEKYLKRWYRAYAKLVTTFPSSCLTFQIMCPDSGFLNVHYSLSIFSVAVTHFKSLPMHQTGRHLSTALFQSSVVALPVLLLSREEVF